jgi:hypothetical protein
VGLHPTRDAWLALQFDQAVTLLGRYIDGRLAEHHDDGTPKHTLTALLADAPQHAAPTAGRFQNPTALLKGGVYEL